MRKILRSNLRPSILIFLFGLIFRLVLIPFGNHPDILSIAGWGKWIYQNGANGFYENKIWIYSWPTQAPLFNLLIGWTHSGYELTLNLMRWLTFNIVPHLAPGHMRWWFDWVWWWERTLFRPTNFFYGYIMWIKIPPIIADLVIAVIIFFVGKKYANSKQALLVSGLFLILPFGWYLSSLWGQYDQLVALLVLLAFLCLNRKLFILSAVLLFSAGQIKATAGYFIPLYVIYFFLQRPSLLSITLSLLSFLGIFWLVTIPFTDKEPIYYMTKIILPRMFLFEDRFYIANHVLNFWQFLYPQIEFIRIHILGLPVFIWGGFFLLIVNIASFAIIFKENNFRSLLVSLYLVAAGNYLFGTGMVDRYFYPALVFLALLVFFYPKLLKLWVLTSILFLINLFYSWGFPFLTIEQVWKNNLLIRVLSLAQLIVFFICLYFVGLLNINFIKKNKLFKLFSKAN